MEALEFLDAIQMELDGALGAVMHALPDGIVLVDSEGLVVFVNERLEELSQYRSEDLIGRPIELLVPAGIRSAHEEHRRELRVVSGHRPMGTGLDVRLRPRDGVEIPVDVELSPIQVGSSSYVIAAVRDNRERKEAAEALRQSEDRFRMFVEASPVMIVSMSPSGTVRSVNGRFVSTAGWRREEVIGMHYAPFIHPDDLPQALGVVARIVRNESVPDHEARLLTASGDYLITESTLVPLTSNGRVVEVLAVIRDITEKRRIEEELRLGRESFRQAFKQGPLGIALLDLQEMITVANSSLCTFVGRTNEELVGTTFTSLIHPDDLERDADLSRQLADGSCTSYQTELRFVTEGRDVANGVVTTSLILGESGASHQTMRTVLDITDSVVLQRELAAQAKTAERILSQLTPRETEVMQLLGTTDTASEMAAQLSVSTRTVESHLANAYRKLGVRTRNEAIDAFDQLTSQIRSVIPDPST
jgi:PAS domain S-box-containing protein